MRCSFLVFSFIGFITSTCFGQGLPVPKHNVRSLHMSPGISCAVIQSDLYPEYAIFVSSDQKLITTTKINECLTKLPKKMESRELAEFAFLEDFKTGVAGTLSCSYIKPAGLPGKFSISFSRVQLISQEIINNCLNDLRALPGQIKKSL